MAKYDVFGMCNPLFDIQAEVSEPLLQRIGFDKGGMFLLEHQQQREIVPMVYDHIVNTEAGGSGANTMIGVAMLGGRAVYTGHIGNDEHGRLYRAGLEKLGVKANLGVGQGDSGVCLVLITPDAQRTMLTYLGLCRELGRDDVVEADIADSKYLYVTAYLWDTETQKQAVTKAMEKASKAGVKVALSLSDPFCVDRHKADFLRLIREHVSVLFGNQQEAMALTDTDTARDAVDRLSEYCDVAVVTMDSNGSLIQAGKQLHEIPAYKVVPVDTTGAGDMYAAGLLYGLSQGLSLPVTGRIASYVAAKVVSKLGPRLESLDQAAIDLIKSGASLDDVQAHEAAAASAS